MKYLIYYKSDNPHLVGSHIETAIFICGSIESAHRWIKICNSIYQKAIKNRIPAYNKWRNDGGDSRSILLRMMQPNKKEQYIIENYLQECNIGSSVFGFKEIRVER